MSPSSAKVDKASSSASMNGLTPWPSKYIRGSGRSLGLAEPPASGGAAVGAAWMKWDAAVAAAVAAYWICAAVVAPTGAEVSSSSSPLQASSRRPAASAARVSAPDATRAVERPPVPSLAKVEAARAAKARTMPIARISALIWGLPAEPVRGARPVYPELQIGTSRNGERFPWPTRGSCTQRRSRGAGGVARGGATPPGRPRGAHRRGRRRCARSAPRRGRAAVQLPCPPSNGACPRAPTYNAACG